MKLDHLAFDIETIPNRPLEAYSSNVQQAVVKKIDRLAATDPEMTYEKFASVNADFGRIVCISVGFVHTNELRLKSYHGDDERAILEAFNTLIASFNGLYLHFNGLGFDVPYILRRMAHHGIRLSTRRFSDLRRFQTEPHLDLMLAYYNWDMRATMPLGVLAELHGLPSPKVDLSGAEVYAAYCRGELDRIARYCEFDVATVLNLWRKAILFEPALDCAPYRLLRADVPAVAFEEAPTDV